MCEEGWLSAVRDVLLGGLFTLVAVPLAANTALAVAVATWSGRIDAVTRT